MAFQYLTNTPLDEARDSFLQTLLAEGFSAGIETVPVSEACGRITARPVYANICAPHYPASAMDGIALNARLTYGAGETTPVTLTQQQFRELDTGDPIPEDCDAVIMIEDVIRQPDNTVKLYSPATPWQHIRQIGEDICAGEMILPSYTEITPAAIGSMIAGGVLKAEVLKKPAVGIIPTGDEIVPPSENPDPGDILEFNSSIFSAMLRRWNAEPIIYPIVPDERKKIRTALLKALEECDIVLLNAGSSAGRDDYSTEMIGSVGNILFHGIAIKPGKPAILAHRKNQPVLGIPGYPVSGIIVLEQLFRPLIDAWYHRQNKPPATCMATLSKNVVSGLKYREFVRVRLGMAGNRIIASPLNRGSGVVSSFMKADGILEVPQGIEGFEAGSSVPVQLLTDPETLNNTLIATGSHDPLLDELADILHASDTSLFMSSSHVGSMGGIMAV